MEKLLLARRLAALLFLSLTVVMAFLAVKAAVSVVGMEIVKHIGYVGHADLDGVEQRFYRLSWAGWLLGTAFLFGAAARRIAPLPDRPRPDIVFRVLFWGSVFLYSLPSVVASVFLMGWYMHGMLWEIVWE